MTDDVVNIVKEVRGSDLMVVGALLTVLSLSRNKPSSVPFFDSTFAAAGNDSGYQVCDCHYTPTIVFKLAVSYLLNWHCQWWRGFSIGASGEGGYDDGFKSERVLAAERLGAARDVGVAERCFYRWLCANGSSLDASDRAGISFDAPYLMLKQTYGSEKTVRKRKKNPFPGKLYPRRPVPDHILKPPCVTSKKPPGIASGPEVHDEKGIECMRAFGVPTDAIDQEVHQMIIDNGARHTT
ncbi:hypothetical protein M8C21_028582 [Ambrosia artemisiifolia]|uniref:Uncharacterized protein n=1 Tax=Ambrosia artemisiifolia TaxID=4212 RepID=A0AAD5C3X7_AMBAR|nr:hypothetical protein M8C21_028582 [Ambrosia artemisiifolia]